MYAFSSSIWIALVAAFLGPAVGMALFIFSAENAAIDASKPIPLITTAMHP